MSNDVGEIGLLLRLAHRRAADALEAVLSPLGLQGRDIGVLMLLARSDGLTQRELAEQLGTDRMAMVRSLDRLAAMGALVRTDHPIDRRAHSIVLTPSGKSLLADTQPHLARVSAALIAHLTPREQDQLESLLRKFLDPGAGRDGEPGVARG